MPKAKRPQIRERGFYLITPKPEHHVFPLPKPPVKGYWTGKEFYFPLFKDFNNVPVRLSDAQVAAAVPC